MKVVSRVVFNKLPRISAGLRPRASRLVLTTTFGIQADITNRMHEQKSGRLYDRPGGKVHQASAPGEAPAIDYGNLVNSIQTEFPSPLKGIVFSNAEYAHYLEFGTDKMAARPAWVPAAEEAWPGFLAGLEDLIDA